MTEIDEFQFMAYVRPKVTIKSIQANEVISMGVVELVKKETTAVNYMSQDINLF